MMTSGEGVTPSNEMMLRTAATGGRWRLATGVAGQWLATLLATLAGHWLARRRDPQLGRSGSRRPQASQCSVASDRWRLLTSPDLFEPRKTPRTPSWAPILLEYHSDR